MDLLLVERSQLALRENLLFLLAWICDSLKDLIEGFFKRFKQQICMHDELIALQKQW